VAGAVAGAVEETELKGVAVLGKDATRELVLAAADLAGSVVSCFSHVVVSPVNVSGYEVILPTLGLGVNNFFRSFFWPVH
jgi:hypothetical protein